MGQCNSKDPGNEELLDLMRWTIQNANSMFSKLYKEGVLIQISRAKPIVQHAYNLVAF